MPRFRNLGLTATIRVDVTIAPSGDVTDARVASIDTKWDASLVRNDEFERLAKMWKFNAVSAGAVRSARLEFVYTMVPDETPSTTLFNPPYRVELRSSKPLPPAYK